jgi:hypothetical protein
MLFCKHLLEHIFKVANIFVQRDFFKAIHMFQTVFNFYDTKSSQ